MKKGEGGGYVKKLEIHSIGRNRNEKGPTTSEHRVCHSYHHHRNKQNCRSSNGGSGCGSGDGLPYPPTSSASPTPSPSPQQPLLFANIYSALHNTPTIGGTYDEER
ncbi:hypothetical protein LOAG_04456 [Loa loa]|uniref:Uncharacterized protein n=1 Tax=Loa loa TaxID=7209 RepID=A0A1S0U241_LOALO|nr:hypothetical protein LOAG_04456 [Loa loa]EFO24031.1 hypothetical protein LOAG_04456 [Loa loa]